MSSSPLSCSCEEAHTLCQIVFKFHQCTHDIRHVNEWLGGGLSSYYMSHPAFLQAETSQLRMNVWIVLAGSRGHKQPLAGGTELDTGLPSTVSRANLAKCRREASGNSSQLQFR